MKFEDALRELADYLTLDAKELAAYAAEDTVGGKDTGWSYLAITADEGRALYAVTRAYQPEGVIEIGAGEGCSTTHFLRALDYPPYGAMVISVDPDPQAGALVPAELNRIWNHICAPGVESLESFYGCEKDFILEDSIHTYDHTFRVLTAAKALNPALLISHDVLSFPGVRQAWTEVANGPVFGFGDNSAGLGFLKGGAWL